MRRAVLPPVPLRIRWLATVFPLVPSYPVRSRSRLPRLPSLSLRSLPSPRLSDPVKAIFRVCFYRSVPVRTGRSVHPPAHHMPPFLPPGSLPRGPKGEVPPPPTWGKGGHWRFGRGLLIRRAGRTANGSQIWTVFCGPRVGRRSGDAQRRGDAPPSSGVPNPMSQYPVGVGGGA